MTTLLADTSVAVPLVLASHVAHRLVDRLVDDRPVYLAGHAAYETYAVLTRLPGDARLTSGDAAVLLRERFAGVAGAPEGASLDVVALLASRGVSGGATYDGLVASAALATPDAVLLSRDLRAVATYGRLGVDVALVAD